MRAVSHQQFLKDPIASFVIGRTYAVWCQSARLAGSIVWGRPDRRDAQEFVDLWFCRQLVDFATLTDASRLEAVEPGLFASLLDALRQRLPTFHGRIERAAMVLPRSDLHKAILAGAPSIIPLPPLEVRICASVGEGLTWLHADHAAADLDVVERAAAQHISAGDVLSALRVYLATDLRAATLDAATRTIGHSARSLQRALSRAGTSFRDELRRVRIHRAAELLAETDDKVEAIAHAVGYASTSHFEEAFEKIMGSTPTKTRGQAR